MSVRSQQRTYPTPVNVYWIRMTIDLSCSACQAPRLQLICVGAFWCGLLRPDLAERTSQKPGNFPLRIKHNVRC